MKKLIPLIAILAILLGTTAYAAKSADVTITAIPIISGTLPEYTVVYNPPMVWEDGDFSWASVDGATEYMLRSDTDTYPKSIVSGDLEQQGTALRTISGMLSYSRYYTLFYKDASDNWLVAYAQRPSARQR